MSIGALKLFVSMNTLIKRAETALEVARKEVDNTTDFDAPSAVKDILKQTTDHTAKIVEQMKQQREILADLLQDSTDLEQLKIAVGVTDAQFKDYAKRLGLEKIEPSKKKKDDKIDGLTALAVQWYAECFHVANVPFDEERFKRTLAEQKTMLEEEGVTPVLRRLVLNTLQSLETVVEKMKTQGGA